MTPFKLIIEPPHLKLKIRGKTLTALFENSALAISELLEPEICRRKPAMFYRRKIAAKSDNLAELLPAFLNKILDHAHFHGEICQKINFKSLKANGTEAEIHVMPVTIMQNHIKRISGQNIDLARKGSYYEALLTIET